MAITQRELLAEDLSALYERCYKFRQLYKMSLCELAGLLSSSSFPSTKNEILKQELFDAWLILDRWLPEIFEVSKEDTATLLEQAIEDDKQRKAEFRIKQLRSMPYADYLQSEHWQQKRKEAHERANGRCQVCNATSSLNVHHRTYIRRGYELPEDLIVLCKGCHQLFHDNGKLERES